MVIENEINVSLFVWVIFILFAVQFFFAVVYSPAKSPLWVGLTSRYTFSGDYDRSENLKRFLYYMNSESNATDNATLQFNGARYGLLEEGLLIRPPAISIGEAILLPWVELSLGGYAKIPITGWRFCKFKKLLLKNSSFVLVIPEELSKRISKPIEIAKNI